MNNKRDEKMIHSLRQFSGKQLEEAAKDWIIRTYDMSSAGVEMETQALVAYIRRLQQDYFLGS